MHLRTLIVVASGLALAASAAAEGIEEVIVTAELRNTPLLQQAASTSLVSARVSSRASRARFYQVRGIGERSQFVEPLNPSIGVVIDGIDFSGLGTAGSLFDVAQVEVLRGPQGTLHGANALAGLININTGMPQDQPELRLDATAAEYGTWSEGLVGT